MASRELPENVQWFAKPLHDRSAMAEARMRRHPECVPIRILSPDGVKFQKLEILCRKTHNGSELARCIRKLIMPGQVMAEHTVLLMVSAAQMMLNHITLVGDVHREYKAPDGYLYISVMRENVFG